MSNNLYIIYKYRIYAIDNETDNIISSAYVKNNNEALKNANYYFKYLIKVHKHQNVTIKILDLDSDAIIEQYDSRIDMV